MKDCASRVQDINDDCCRILVEQSTHANVVISLLFLKSSTSVALVEPTNTLTCSVVVGDCCDLTFEGQVSGPTSSSWLFYLAVLDSVLFHEHWWFFLLVFWLLLFFICIYLLFCILGVLSFAFILHTFHSHFFTSWSLHHRTLTVSSYNLAVIHSFFLNHK